eukprot:scaffold647991_cov35-Prasinocladus_malaysianus.AAC.1
MHKGNHCDRNFRGVRWMADDFGPENTTPAHAQLPCGAGARGHRHAEPPGKPAAARPPWSGRPRRPSEKHPRPAASLCSPDTWRRMGRPDRARSTRLYMRPNNKHQMAA